MKSTRNLAHLFFANPQSQHKKTKEPNSKPTLKKESKFAYRINNI